MAYSTSYEDYAQTYNFSLCTCIPYIILKLKPFENKEQQDTSKHTTKKMKRQPKEWKKIFLNHVCDKGLVCRICTYFGLVSAYG